ncbi:MAG: arginine deiminase [Chitinophagaceae bacterium]|nr:MAG: arginine deiminase [Chitinophagaceae bacterium]
MNLKLNSEFGTLKAVLTHQPGREIDRLTPYNIKEYLFEDVPYLEGVQEEHKEFTNLISQSCGAKIYRLKDLLIDIFIDDDLLLKCFQDALKRSSHARLAEEIIDRFSTAECANAMIGGLKVREIKHRIKTTTLKNESDSTFLIHPLPNLYFMRDPAAITPGGVICSRMKTKARHREAAILRNVFEHHPDFKEHFVPVFDGGEFTFDDDKPCIEGGDVIVLSSKALAVGNSERTDESAIKELARNLFKNSSVERVYQVNLPHKRNFMHLDTVFTIIDENLVVTYPDALEAILETKVYRADEKGVSGEMSIVTETVKEDFVSVLKNEIDHLEVISTGDGNPDYASREQWYDGANVFAIGPRRVISYNRNKHTNRALREAGVDVLEVRSAELSRGLGGPRCMTMPLWRQDF